jgi:hypothetical protein
VHLSPWFRHHRCDAEAFETAVNEELERRKQEKTKKKAKSKPNTPLEQLASLEIPVEGSQHPLEQKVSEFLTLEGE